VRTDGARRRKGRKTIATTIRREPGARSRHPAIGRTKPGSSARTRPRRTAGSRAAPFSICLPVWNGADLVHIAIDGIRAQTEPRWRLIVGDNASTDRLAEVIAAYDDPRIVYHRWDDHVDTEANYNRTVGLATGDWVIPIGADDRLHPRALETMLAAITPRLEPRPGRRPIAMALTACHRVYPDGSSADADYYGSTRPPEVPSGRYDATRWLQVAATGGPFPWNFGSAAFSRDFLGKNDLLRVEVGLAADTELIFRAAAHGDVVYIDEPLLDFMVRPESDGNQRWASNRAHESATPLARALLSALEAHEAARPVSRAESDAIRETAAWTHLRRAAQHRVLPGGRGRRGALADIARAVRLWPGALFTRRGIVLVGGSILAPSWLLRRISASMRDRAHGRSPEGRSSTGEPSTG
jgi:glycosyltransferase involved in cell wall biosynthesis